MPQIVRSQVFNSCSHITVDSVAATVDKVIAEGGKIVQAVGMDAPEITARFSDPTGGM
jgi:hypothetical protein